MPRPILRPTILRHGLRLAPLVLLALGACTMVAPPPTSRPAPGASGAAAPPLDATAERAVSACRAEAAAQGLAVRGVERAEEVRDTAGVALGQNVFLAVSRSGAPFSLRCSYSYASAEARIRLL